MSEPTDKPAVPMVAFTAPSGRVYTYQEDWEGEISIAVANTDADAPYLRASVSMEDFDALQTQMMREQVIAAVREMNDRDLFKIIGAIALFDI